MVEEFRINGSTSVEFNGPDQIAWTRHGLSTGDAIHYAPGVSSPDANKVIGGLTVDTIYYAIKVDDTNFKCSCNATDAANGTAINITPASQNGYYFRRQDSAALDNITITCKLWAIHSTLLLLVLVVLAVHLILYTIVIHMMLINF